MLSFNDIMPTKSIGGYKQNKFKNKQHNILGHLLHFKKGWMVYIPDIIE